MNELAYLAVLCLILFCYANAINWIGTRTERKERTERTERTEKTKETVAVEISNLVSPEWIRKNLLDSTDNDDEVIG